MQAEPATQFLRDGLIWPDIPGLFDRLSGEIPLSEHLKSRTTFLFSWQCCNARLQLLEGTHPFQQSRFQNTLGVTVSWSGQGE